jgi:hypothetical protein
MNYVCWFQSVIILMVEVDHSTEFIYLLVINYFFSVLNGALTEIRYNR